MNILIYPVVMEIGGSQLNALELAAGMSAAGHNVVVFGPGGDLMALVEQLGIEYIEAPGEYRWPAMRSIAALTRIVRSRSIDVVHGFEWRPALELMFGPHLCFGTPLVTTVMSMYVSGFLPMHTHLVVGTAELAEEQRDLRPVHLLEPWIMEDHNAPGVAGGFAPRKAFGFGQNDLVVSVVGRLTTDLEKLDGVLDAIDVIGSMARDSSRLPTMRLLVVGGGLGLEAVRKKAKDVNRGHSHNIVEVTGPMLDPRIAYDCSDVVLGMGSSALKGLAFGKPVIVQGAQGFWRLFDESSRDSFLYQGMYGSGTNPDGMVGQEALAGLLAELAADPDRRAELGDLGRKLITERFSLSGAVAKQLEIYRQAITDRSSRTTRYLAVSVSALKFAKSLLARLRG